MNALTLAMVGFVGLLHVYILVLEMFLWTRPHGLKVFGQKPEQAEASKVLAKNQGLYNGFLAAGIFIGLWLGEAGSLLVTFSLACVIAAGVYGAITARVKILFIQGLPAMIALGLWLLR
ncbi:MAG: DUF1304 domain-containing protein [Gammaproteobacteria bacterium]|nr:DUF1304 domain-containing protein [Gammaproteobacteria bacterium]